MKIFNAEQIQKWDAYTMAHEPVASIDLMERAAQSCTEWLTEKGIAEKPVKIFCGKGNNGGDGLAIARQLIEAGCDVRVFIIELGVKGTNDFQTNLAKLHAVNANIFFIQSAEFFPEITGNEMVIDALFGSGLNRPLKELYAETVKYINAHAKTVVAIDVPSGLFLDRSSKGNVVIEAKYTLTFECLKLCFLVAENEKYFGNIVVLNIGLHKDYPATVETVFYLTTPPLVKKIYRPRKKFTHKGTYGHALLFAGNKGKMGAAVLCAKACLRTGAGLLTCNIPEDEFTIIQTAVPEAMVIKRDDKTHYQKYTVVGAGPGIGTEEFTAKLFHQFITSFHKTMVLDADALNILSENKEWLSLLKDVILTPHPKEFERVFGTCENDFERIDKALEFSEKHKLVIVLKGHYTLIAYNGKGYFNTTGNAGMAKGGSGDVLTGMLTALLSQNYKPLDAALLGVFLHGLAGDIALKKQSTESMLPSDLIENIGKAFKEVAGF
jgi:NAD(P)H-hydrate epimerase